MYREVPNYSLFQFREKCFDYCVVIPVINENGRITEQLKRMIHYDIHCIADIIIADGDSTDGSTPPTAQNNAIAPSNTRRDRSTSIVKST